MAVYINKKDKKKVEAIQYLDIASIHSLMELFNDEGWQGSPEGLKYHYGPVSSVIVKKGEYVIKSDEGKPIIMGMAKFESLYTKQ